MDQRSQTPTRLAAPNGHSARRRLRAAQDWGVTVESSRKWGSSPEEVFHKLLPSDRSCRARALSQLAFVCTRKSLPPTSILICFYAPYLIIMRWGEKSSQCGLPLRPGLQSTTILQSAHSLKIAYPSSHTFPCSSCPCNAGADTTVPANDREKTPSQPPTQPPIQPALEYLKRFFGFFYFFEFVQLPKYRKFNDFCPPP